MSSNNAFSICITALPRKKNSINTALRLKEIFKKVFINYEN